MGAIIAMANKKGGVGKTTTTVHIGAGMAQLGHRVLLVDGDNQCDLTFALGIDNSKYNLLNLLEGTGKLRLTQKAEGYYVLPGSEEFYASQHDKDALKRNLEPLRLHFDYIIIDAPPAEINPYDVTPVVMSLVACDYFLVPLEAEMFAVKNANTFLGNVYKHIAPLNSDMEFLGFFFNNVLVTKNAIKKFSAKMEKAAANLLFRSIIRQDAEIGNAIEKKKTIFQHRPYSRSGQDYTKLVGEIVSKIKKMEAHEQEGARACGL